jgi:hypothetical protein
MRLCGDATVLAARAIDPQVRDGADDILVTADMIEVIMRRQNGDELQATAIDFGHHVGGLGAIDHTAFLTGVVHNQVGVIVG